VNEKLPTVALGSELFVPAAATIPAPITRARTIAIANTLLIMFLNRLNQSIRLLVQDCTKILFGKF
jgi:hypothetical protein